MTESTVNKRDWPLHDAESALVGAIRHFDLERVAVGADGIEIQTLENACRKAFEPAGQVVEWQSQDQSRVERAALAEQAAHNWPVLCLTTPHVPRAQHHVNIFERGAQRRERTRIVREIGVHLEDMLITPREGVVEAGPIRRAQALFASAVQHRHPLWEAGGERFRELASAVWRVVVDDQHVKCALSQDLLHKGLQVFDFVVGWDDDQAVVHCLTTPEDYLLTRSISSFTSPCSTDHTTCEWSSACRIHVSPPSALFSNIASRILLDITT